MVKEEKKPYGYIYKVTNPINGKNYIGKTKNTIEERWSKHLEEARALERAREANPYKKISGTHINNAINKYGSNAFNINQEDVAYSRAELNEKERYWVKEYDSMNPDKGYNMTEGGEGGRPSQEVIEKMTKINREITQRPEYREKMRKIMKEKAKDPIWRENVGKGVSKKYQDDPDFKQRQAQASRERAKDPQWIEKMTKINQERAKNPEWREKMSQVGKEKWNKDPEYRDKQANERRERGKNPEFIEKMTKINQERAKNPEWIQKMKDINRDKRKEIEDKREFLDELKNKVPKKELVEKYGMDGKTLNRRIGEMFGSNGPKNYTELKDHLQDKNVGDVLKDINNNSGEKRDSSSENTNDENKEETPEESKQEEDNDEKQSEEKDKEKDDEKGEESTEQILEKENLIEKATGNESSESVDKMSKPETTKPRDSRLKEGDIISIEIIDGDKNVVVHGSIYSDENHQFTLTSGEEQRQPVQRSSKDYDGIDESPGDKKFDYDGIDTPSEDEKSDIKSLDGGVEEQGNNYDGIDDPQEDGDKDYDKIDDGYYDGGSEGEGAP